MEREREREKIPGKGLMQRQCHNRKKGFKLECGRAQRPAPTRDYRPFVGVNLVFTRFKDNPIIPVGVNLVFTRDCDTVSSANPK
jgi:hypothetical protein